MQPLIEWKDSYALGIDEVDDDHRALIGLINDLHEALGDKAGDDAIVRFLSEVHRQAAAHFAIEERIMRRTRYPEYDAHKADHARLLDGLLDIIDDYAEVYSLTPKLLGVRLEDWFMVHFRTFDARYHGQT